MSEEYVCAFCQLTDEDPWPCCESAEATAQCHFMQPIEVSPDFMPIPNDRAGIAAWQEMIDDGSAWTVPQVDGVLGRTANTLILLTICKPPATAAAQWDRLKFER